MPAGKSRGLIATAALALAWGLAGIVPLAAQDDAVAAAANEQHIAIDPAAVPDCARDPDKLGIERVVEIDAAEGSVFGSSHRYNDFLKDREVVLTFDDGPMRAYTRRVLAALEAHCTRATFFMVGRMAAADPAMVKEVIAAGHTAGTHTYAHKNLKPLGFAKARADFEMGVSTITKAAGTPIAPFFRFPYLSENRQLLDYIKKRETATFYIDVDSKDFQTRNSDIVFNRVMAQLGKTGKGIILMHDIQPSTVGMMPRLLDALHDKGYKVVHIVPKWAATTVAEFDDPAEAELAAKSGKARKDPLAGRSVVWTMPAAAKAGEDAAAAAAPAAKRAAPAAAQAKNDALPWTQKTKPAAVRRPQRQEEELPWQARVFAN
jgi:peptidoglycan/xylan/chitin deacetylase (PgdA/CDA1 family)